MRMEEASHGGARARNGERPVGGWMVESSGEPFMSPLGQGKIKFKGSSRVTDQHNCLGRLMLWEMRRIGVM